VLAAASTQTFTGAAGFASIREAMHVLHNPADEFPGD
jgi:hypothetical protein